MVLGHFGPNFILCTVPLSSGLDYIELVLAQLRKAQPIVTVFKIWQFLAHSETSQWKIKKLAQREN